MKTSFISQVLLLELKFVSRDSSMQGNLLKLLIALYISPDEAHAR